MKKSFDGKFYRGRYDKGKKTYKIKYEDGDMTVVTEGEIEKLIVPCRHLM